MHSCLPNIPNSHRQLCIVTVSIIPFQYNEKQCKITPLYINLVNIIINLIKDFTRYKGFVTGFVIFQIAEEAKTESLSRDILSFQLDMVLM